MIGNAIEWATARGRRAFGKAPLLEPANVTATPAGLPARTIWLMSAACGASAANIYYNQPLLADFAKYFHATESQAGLVATAAQVGYGVGMLFFVPLGDLLERRKIVLTLVVVCIALLLATSAAPSLRLLVALQFLVGVTAMSSQLLIPLGIDLTPPDRRGHTVGVLMAGLLCGILLARTLAGFVSDQLGWRAMYFLAAGIMLALAGLLYRGLPHRAPTLKMSYPELMHSMIGLAASQPRLWPASLVSALSFGCFTVFWTALSFLMQEQFHRGATEAGLFGVVGVIGALAAPLAGKASDRNGPAFTVTLALLSTMAAFVLMGVWVTIPGLIVGVLLMDLGVQSIQVAEQAQVMALVPAARSRINTLYMVSRFVGGAAGSAAGALAWTHGRWPGVCGLALGMLAVALVIHFVGAMLFTEANKSAI